MSKFFDLMETIGRSGTLYHIVYFLFFITLVYKGEPTLSLILAFIYISVGQIQNEIRNPK